MQDPGGKFVFSSTRTDFHLKMQLKFNFQSMSRAVVWYPQQAVPLWSIIPECGTGYPGAGNAKRRLTTLQYPVLRLKVKKEQELKAAIAGSNWGKQLARHRQFF